MLRAMKRLYHSGYIAGFLMNVLISDLKSKCTLAHMYIHTRTYTCTLTHTHTVMYIHTEYIPIYMYICLVIPCLQNCLLTFSHLICTHSPKSDTCKVCGSFKVKVDAEDDPTLKEQLTLEWMLHKIQAEVGYNSLKEYSAYAKCHNDTELLTFDLEKSLPTPVLSTGIVYFKQQLWTYNQGIHDCSTEQGCMHMWHEGIASRGSHEVGSCLLAHLKEMQTSATKIYCVQ